MRQKVKSRVQKEGETIGTGLRVRRETAGLSVYGGRGGWAVIVRVFYASSGGDPRIETGLSASGVWVRGLGTTGKKGFGNPSSGSAIVGCGRFRKIKHSPPRGVIFPVNPITKLRAASSVPRSCW